MDKAIYIGSGLDVRPIRAIDQIRHFIYIDSMPRSYCPNTLLPPRNQESRLLYLDRWIDKMTLLGFECPRIPENTIDPFSMKFHRSDGKTLTYYFNTNFPTGINSEIRHHLTSTSNLVIAGHHPHQEILKWMKTPIQVKAFEGTYYGSEELEEGVVLSKFYDHPELVKSIEYYEKRYIPKTFDDFSKIEQYTANK